MFHRLVLLLATLRFCSVAAQGECTDLHGRTVTNGFHYIPGPDTCTLCICDNGLPRVCKAVLCSPPQDCRSFRVGSTCCEFICLDDVVKPAEAHDANFRLVGGGVGGIVLITIAFSVYRVRKQKRQQPPHIDDRGSLTSIGYISGSMGCMGGACEPAAGAWKPPGHYLPRGEAPPPYEEAMAQCRSDQIRFGEAAMRPAYSTNLEPIARPEDSIQCVGHGYVNLTRPVAQIPNTQSCFTAPLLQPVHGGEVRDNTHHPLPTPIGRGLFRLTGSLGAISRGALSVPRDDERPHNVPGFYAHSSMHRTIPRLSPATDSSALSCFTRERSCGEVRRSFHRPEPTRHHHPTSVPRNLNIASSTDAETSFDDELIVKPSAGRSRAQSEEQVVSERKSKPQTPSRVAPSNISSHVSSNMTPSHVATSNMANHGPSNMSNHGASNMSNHVTNIPSHVAPSNMTSHATNISNHVAPTNMASSHVASANMTSNHITSANMSSNHITSANMTSNHVPSVNMSSNHVAPANMTSNHVAPTNMAPTQPQTSHVMSNHTKPAESNSLPPQSTLPLTVDKPSCGCSYDARDDHDDHDDYRSECENCNTTDNGRWEEGEWSCGTQTLQRRAPPPAPPPPHTATLPQPVTRHERNPIGQPSNWENWFNTIPDSDTESEEE